MIWYKVKKYSLDVSISGLCGLERVKGKITYTKGNVFDKMCFSIILLISKNYCKYFLGILSDSILYFSKRICSQ